MDYSVMVVKTKFSLSALPEMLKLVKDIEKDINGKLLLDGSAHNFVAEYLTLIKDVLNVEEYLNVKIEYNRL